MRLAPTSSAVGAGWFRNLLAGRTTHRNTLGYSYLLLCPRSQSALLRPFTSSYTSSGHEEVHRTTPNDGPSRERHNSNNSSGDTGRQRLRAHPRAGRRLDEVRSLRRQLLLRVHPDLFQAPHHAQARAVNQRSLQAFQSLVALAGHAPSSSSSSFPLPASADNESAPLFTFHFFLRPPAPAADDDMETPVPHHQRQQQQQQQLREEPLREVRYQFHPSPDVRRNANRLRRAAEDCMLHLFALAGLTQAPAHADPATLQTQDGWVRTNWSEAALRQKSIDALRFAPGEVKLAYHEELAAMLNPDMIFFDKLTYSQKLRAVTSLTSNLTRLGYADWADIPLLIGKQYSRRVEGVVVVPYNFTVPRLVEFLNKNLPDIRRERNNIRADVHLLADLTQRLQERLGLQDVSVWGSKRGAIGCLQRLTDITADMAAHDLAQATLILTDPSHHPQQQPATPPRESEQLDASQTAANDAGANNNNNDKDDGTGGDDGGDGDSDGQKQYFRFDPVRRRLFVRKDFEKPALLAFLRRVCPRPGDAVEPPPSAASPPLPGQPPVV